MGGDLFGTGFPALPGLRHPVSLYQRNAKKRARREQDARAPDIPGRLLFAPLSLREVRLRNRIVVPPMHQYSAVKGFPTDWHLINAGKFAAGGAGLVIIESTKVERRGCGTVGDLGISGTTPSSSR